MRILFEEHAEKQRVGGIEAATHGLATSLGANGLQVTRRLSKRLDRDLNYPDCVHLHGFWSPSLAGRIVYWRLQGVPCVVTVHGMLEPIAFAHKKIKKQIVWHLYLKRLLNQVSALHATSEREAENLRKLGLKVPISVIPWGVEMPEKNSEVLNFEGRVGQGETGKATFSSIQNPVRAALYVGRICSVKGLVMLVEAWASLRPEGWRMKIVGPDETGHRAELEALVREAGLQAEFEFTGPIKGSALSKAYSAADLFILPSYTENFGMVVAEAMAHGLPVITTEGAPWRILQSNGCGWWVPVSAEGITDALRDAVRKSPEELSCMGERARKVVAEHFTWSTSARRFETLYQWLLGKRDWPSFVGR